jgi:hypothetical protein
MKKNYILLILLSCFTQVNAQVINGDFETIKENGRVSNWGMDFTQLVYFNLENNTIEVDQIQYDDCQFIGCIPSNDAQNGNHALEIRNALNVSRQEVIKGKATLFNNPELDIPGWNAGMEVVDIPVDFFGFYYKFNALGNEIAEAYIKVIGDNYTEFEASIDLTNVTSYTYVSTPIVMPEGENPVYTYIEFRMAKEGQTPVFGSRLTIDNLRLNNVTLGIDENELLAPKFNVFPSITDGYLTLSGDFKSNTTYSYSIFDLQGKKVQSQNIDYVYNINAFIDVGELSSGMYLVSVNFNGNVLTKKFVRR